MYYAQINNAGVCFAVTQTAGPIVAGDMVPIAGYDLSYLGRTYAAGVWS